MAELAKSHITVTDDSAYSTGIDTLIPLYVFATASNKVVDETTGAIAIGTTKDLANQVSIVTSKKDVIDKFGVPFFAESNGTVLQGDERNEYGLYGLFDAMGTTSLAYALRADIDLAQLEPKETKPTAPVKNNTYWVDMVNTSFGLFRCNGGTSKAEQWDALGDFSYYEKETLDENSKPLSTAGDVGDFAVTYIDGLFKFYEKTDKTTWTEIGSDTTVFHSSAIKYPENPTEGNIWVKTTAVNGGADYSLKRYSSSSELWYDASLPVVTSFVDAEAAFGSQLADGAKALLCGEGTDGQIYQYVKSETGFTITGTATSETTLSTSAMLIKLVVDGALKTIKINATTDESVDDLIDDINETLKDKGVKGLTAEYDTDGKIQLVASTISVLNIADSTVSTDASLATILGFELGDHYPATSGSWKVFKDAIASYTEPRDDAEEGTLWFNDDIKVDIMVNNGSSWQGFDNYYAEQDEKPGIFVTSAEPSTAADFSLWINPAEEDFPVIRRMIAGEWQLIDNSDQTTPAGIVFADARYYAAEDAEPTYSTDETTGKVSSNLLTSDKIDPDCPNPETYPAEILLFNTRFSTNNVKEYKANPFVGLYDETTFKYDVGGTEFTLNKDKLARWVSASGNAADGRGLFGRNAQRKMVVNALASAIKSNEDIRTFDYDFFFATCPGYPELDDELISLNTEKKEMFEIITDTPARLAPDGAKIQDWATNKNNAVSHGADGRVLKNTYVTRQYPPMGMATNVDGSEIAVPSSIVKMNNLLVLPRGQICAGTQNGQVTNVASVGYITDEDEYASVLIKDGLGEVLVANAINPIMPRRGTGLLFWGEYTENPYTSALSDEHVIITLLRLKRELEQAIQPYFFRINTESLRNDFHKTLKGILDEFVSTEEIYDYTIETGAGVNTADRINRKELWAYIAIEPSKGIEQIFLPIRVVSTGALSNS